VLSSSFAFGETTNNADVLWAGAWAGTSRIIVTHTGMDYTRWGNNLNSMFVTLTGQISSWGTSQRTVSIRVGSGGSSGAGKVVNIDRSYNSQSTGARDVNFIMMEIS
jgi:hypothetical protein